MHNEVFLLGIEKYRVHEVAKDFNLPTKTITEILTKYVAAPKNHMQVLSDHELSVIFDYLTQHNQVSGIQVIYADAEQEKPQPAAPVKQEAAAPKAAPAQQAKAQTPAGKPAQQGAKPAPIQQPVSRVPQKKIVDTRKGGDVNLAKYDQRLEELGGQLADWNFELRGAQSWIADENRWNYNEVKVHLPNGDYEFKL